MQCKQGIADFTGLWLLLFKNKVSAVFYTYHNVNFIGPHSLCAAGDLTAIPALLLLHGVGNLKCTDALNFAL